MSLLSTITPEEYARQLRNPVGSLGLAVADAISQYNRGGNLAAIDALALDRDATVLELGCGTGAMAEIVLGQAENGVYIGLDSSSTMIEVAKTRNLHLCQQGLVDFHCGMAGEMPFDDLMFTHAFSIGVAHFWPDPIQELTEVYRVLRPGGLMLMGCLTPERAPSFAREEFGFHLRDPESWRSLCLGAGFRDVEVRTRDIDPGKGPRVLDLAARV